ncbi:NACHT domain-containing protein [Streptomyces noursei]|uniref:NACHT domain-containing protein n=1 Tax=Streptomyces noursei TaxID=1971 RepID=UPI000C99FC3B|nr:NACHT domain-containing protein [Streptomyces noursei]
MSLAPEPRESGPAPTPARSSGESAITVGDVSGILSIGDHNVNLLFTKGFGAEDALAKLVKQLVHAVRAERRSQLADKADLLAIEVDARLQHEEEQLRLQDRSKLTVHWQPVAGKEPGRREDIRNDPAGAPDAPPPGLRQLDEFTVGRERTELRWLMVLGREGSGKSVLALKFALNRLKVRPPDGEAPVPVIFSLGSWNPGTTSLRRWLIGRLERDHPFLAEASPSGRTWAAALVGAKYVLPILDGFDEIAIGLRKRALIALNRSTLPLLVTSRRSEMEAAAEGNVVPSAAAIELIDITLDDSVTYLQEATGTPASDGRDDTPRAGWAYVLDELSRRPHTQASANLAAVLTTPLMVTLARFVYESDSDSSKRPDHDPSDLLKSKKLDTREALEKHLLDSYIRTAYERLPAEEPEAQEEEIRRWDAERAQHWLGYLAAHLTELNTPDIEWWRLGVTVKLRWIMLRVGVTVAIASGLVAGLVNGSEEALIKGAANGLVVAGITGPLNGLGLGLTFGLMHGFVTKMKVGGPMFEPSLMEIKLRGWTKNGTKTRLRESFRPRVTRGLAGGLLFGLVWALGLAALAALAGSSWPVIAPYAEAHLAAGIGLGFAMGLIAALGAGFETVIPREKHALPSDLLNTNRATVLKQLLTVGLVIGSGYGIMFGLDPSHSALGGLGAGLAAGSMIAFGVGTMTAWGRWVVLARIWLPLTGWLPRDLDAFLQDAYERGVLRQVGTVYQFRHAQLRDHLCRTADTPPERILHRTDNGNLNRPSDAADTDDHG